MIDRSVLKKGWALLDRREQRSAVLTLIIIILSAFASAAIVGSIMPFLTVLSDPSRIQTNGTLAWLYEVGGFTDNYSFLVFLGIASFVVIVTSCLVLVLKTYAVARFSMLRVHSISKRLIGSYLGQSYDFFLHRHSGEMTKRIVAESQLVVGQFMRPAAEGLASLLTVMAIVGLLIWVNREVALSALFVFGGCYLLVYTLVRRRLAALGKIRVDANGKRFRIASEALSGVKEIKLLGRERDYVTRYSGPSLEMARAMVKSAVLSTVPQYALQGIVLGGVILLCLVLMSPSEMVSKETLGSVLPTLGVFALAGLRLMPEFQRLYRSLAELQGATAAVEEVHRDLVTLGSAEGPPKAPATALGLKKNLVIDNIQYTYPSAEKAGLRDISFEISAGEKIGVVGSSGAGKTTLADILLGLLQPAEGALVVDGTRIDADNVRAWQKSVGYVPQNIFLADASVAENIALGVPEDEIDEKQVRASAENAQLDTFVLSELPDGYNTHVGERGVRLSGGQRQRIGIARALYHDADLIVFDEATSALDNLTEKQVMTSVEALPGDKTVLMIAHRLSTVRICDRIIVLDHGRLADFGTWDALMERCPQFQQLISQADAA